MLFVDWWDLAVLVGVVHINDPNLSFAKVDRGSGTCIGIVQQAMISLLVHGLADIGVGLVDIGVDLVDIEADLVDIGVGLVDTEADWVDIGDDLAHIGVGLVDTVVDLDMAHLKVAIDK